MSSKIQKTKKAWSTVNSYFAYIYKLEILTSNLFNE